MTLLADQIDTLARLLPATSVDANAVTVRAELRSAAAVLAQAMQAALDLRMEADPRFTYEMLDCFEQTYGVPDYCADLEFTVADRRLAVLAKINEIGGQTPIYFEQIAASLGYAGARVVEFLPFTCTDPCAQALGSDAWRNVWSIQSPDATRITYFRCGSPCNEKLANWSLIEALQCVINRLKPAHTLCYFKFGP